MQVTSEGMKIQGLSTPQVLMVSKNCAQSSWSWFFFFSVSDDYKYTYVKGLLIPNQADK